LFLLPGRLLLVFSLLYDMFPVIDSSPRTNSVRMEWFSERCRLLEALQRAPPIQRKVEAVSKLVFSRCRVQARWEAIFDSPRRLATKERRLNAIPNGSLNRKKGVI